MIQISTLSKAMSEVLKPIEDMPFQQFLLTTLAKYKDPETGKYRYKSKIPLGFYDSLIKGNIPNWEYTMGIANIPSVHQVKL